MKGHNNLRSAYPDSQPPLSSDLEWMLESHQSSPQMLAEALVQGYYPEIYRLLLALVGDPRAARRAARLGFSSALLDISNYRSADGVRAWLCFHTLKSYQRLRPGLLLNRAWHAFAPGKAFGLQPGPHLLPDPSSWQEACIWLAADALDERSRWAVILTYLFDWPPTEVANLLQVSPAGLAALLERARRKLLSSLAKDGFTLADFSGQDFETSLRAAVQRRTPPAEIDVPGMQALIETLGHQAGRQLARRRTVGQLKDVVWVGLTILVVVVLMYRLNLLLPEKNASPSGTHETATPAPSLDPRTQLLTLEYMVRLGDTLVSIGERLGISSETLAGINHLAANLSPQPIQSLFVVIPLATPEPSPTAQQPAANRPGPLSEHSSEADLRNFLSQSDTLWHTLWLDALDIQYGPMGYVGPTQALRYQVYISHEEQLLEMSMDFSGRLAGVVLSAGGLQYGISAYAGSAYAESTEPVNFFLSRWDSMVFPSHSSWLEEAGSLQVLGSAEIAGRETVVVEWRSAGRDGEDYPPRRSRLWIDTATGIILRMQHFGGSDAGTLLVDLAVSQIRIDTDNPRASLYDPQMLREATPAPYFRNDPYKYYPGTPLLATGHERLDKIEAPAGFDAAESALTFQYPQDRDNPLPLRGAYSVDLFADGYFLNTVKMSDPWTIRCERSPDGKRLAFIDGNRSPAWEMAFAWLSLAPSYHLNFYRLEVDPLSFAFAPDSHHVAVFGIEKDRLAGMLYLIDLDGRGVRKLEEIWRADSLVWSPDGRYLSLVAWPESWLQPEVQVIDVARRQVVYRKPIVYHSLLMRDYPNWPAVDWPGHAWGVKFPQLHIGLESCAQPPRN